MNLSEALDIQGRLTIQKLDRENRSIEIVRANNSIVLTGRELVAKLFMKDSSVNPVSHVAVGTNPNDKKVSVNDEKLANEIFRKAIRPIEVARDLQEVPDKREVPDQDKIPRKKVIIAADLDLDEANNQTLKEAALFTGDKDDTSALMYNRVVFPAISKTADFKLTLIWEIIF